MCVIYVIFTCAVYKTSLSSLCCTLSCFGPRYTRDRCNCCTILHYSYELMNFWCCKLTNLSNQKSYSYWQWQQVRTFMSICHEGPEMSLNNCPAFDVLILWKIVIIVATICHIFRLRCTKFNFGWGYLSRTLTVVLQLRTSFLTCTFPVTVQTQLVTNFERGHSQGHVILIFLGVSSQKLQNG